MKTIFKTILTVLLTLIVSMVTIFAFDIKQQTKQISFEVGVFNLNISQFDKDNDYDIGDLFIFNNMIFKVRNWFNPSLFLNSDGTINFNYVVPYGPVIEITDYYRPYNTYYEGDIVIHNDYEWQVRHEGANWTEPGSNSNAWQRLGEEWFRYNTYQKDDIVKYNNKYYKAIYYSFDRSPVDYPDNWLEIEM